ncbi:MAG: cupin domain-containing protein [Clostridia bacterium]|nr:cupin domain-containing protein [Clostridia bacterium]
MEIREQTFNVYSNEGWKTVTEEGMGTYKVLPMISDTDFDGMQITCILYPAGFRRPAHSMSAGSGVYVIDGSFTTEEGTFEKGTLIWHPKDHVYSYSTQTGCKLLFITSKACEGTYYDAVPKTQATQTLISNIFEKDGWVVGEEPVGAFFDDKPVVTDPENGAIVNFSHYPEGFYKPYHRHTCSHGVLVIDGVEKTASGNYAPGSFIWHPAGIQVGHGPADGKDCLFMFIANKPFDIEFLQEE